MKKFVSEAETNGSVHSSGSRSPDPQSHPFLHSSARPPKSLRFFGGAALIVVSFSVYLAYPVILLYLPFSVSAKAGATVAVWVLSWTAFSVGLFLTGPQGYEWLKGLWARRTGGNGRKRPA